MTNRSDLPAKKYCDVDEGSGPPYFCCTETPHRATCGAQSSRRWLAPRSGRMIIFIFPSKDVAKRWYADPQYQVLSDHRRAGTQLEFLTMVRCLPPRG